MFFPQWQTNTPIRGTWPEATVQTCVVHMVRNSLRCASRKHWNEIGRQMRAVYEAPTVEAAQAQFFDEAPYSYGALLALLVLPLYIPALIFGVAAVDASLVGLAAVPHLCRPARHLRPRTTGRLD